MHRSSISRESLLAIRKEKRERPGETASGEGKKRLKRKKSDVRAGE
jgi:hypothetical protein